LVVASLVVAPSARAHADEPEPPPSEPAANAPRSADPIAEQARAHHRRGLQLYDEGDYRLAVVELERAYEISRSYKVLFNIGQVYFQLNAYAKARRALEQYLRDGGAEIAEARRADVEKDLATLRTRTATLVVRSNVAGAEVTIDDAVVGKAPLEGVLVDAGTRRVMLTSPGYMARTRDVTVAGGDVKTVAIELAEVKPAVVVRTTGLPAATIVAWIATGVLAAGATGTGIAANAAASTYETKRESPIPGSPEQARADLDRQRDLVSGLALATDVLAVSTIVAGGIALYLTLREKKTDPLPPRAGIALCRSCRGATGFTLAF